MGMAGHAGRNLIDCWIPDCYGYREITGTSRIWNFIPPPPPTPRTFPPHSPGFKDGFKAPRGRPDPKNRPKKFRPDCLQVPRIRSGLVPSRHSTCLQTLGWLGASGRGKSVRPGLFRGNGKWLPSYVCIFFSTTSRDGGL